MVRFPKKLWCCIGMEYYNIIWFNQGSRRLWRFFSWFSGLPPSTKNQHSQFQFDLETVGKKSHLWQFPLINSIQFIVSSYYYYYYYLFGFLFLINWVQLHKLTTIRVFKTDVFQALALRQIENKNVPQWLCTYLLF